MKIKDLEEIGSGGSSGPPRSQTGSVIISPWEVETEESPQGPGQPGYRTRSKLKYIGVLLSVQAGGAASSSSPREGWGEVSG